MPGMWNGLIWALIGWLAGLVVNVLADGLPARRRVGARRGRLVCAHCDQPQGWRGYALWPRRCADCGRGRLRPWAVEAVFVAATLWLAANPSQRLNAWIALALLIYFGVVTVIDLEHRLILHPVSLAGVLLGGGVGVWLHGWGATLLGGAAGFAIMYGLYALGGLFLRLINRWRAQPVEEVALGFGDVNLAGVIGLLLGWPGVLAGLTLAILIGGVFSLLWLLGQFVLRRYRAFEPIPYGPFLVAGALILLFLRL